MEEEKEEEEEMEEKEEKEEEKEEEEKEEEKEKEEKEEEKEEEEKEEEKEEEEEIEEEKEEEEGGREDSMSGLYYIYISVRRFLQEAKFCKRDFTYQQNSAGSRPFQQFFIPSIARASFDQINQ